VGAYRARDLLLPPSQLSLTRIPLAIAFPFVVGSPMGATVVLALAGASDVLDGWWARRKNMVTSTGAAIDPVTDKIFVLTFVITLVTRHYLDLMSVVWMSTREIGELPLVIWLLASKHARQTRREHARALPLGKLATALQFSTVACAVWRWEQTSILVIVTAIAGVLAAMGYWRLMLRSRPLADPVAADREKPNDLVE
jgi:phosphatidylglycerophosphate synthase